VSSREQAPDSRSPSLVENDVGEPAFRIPGDEPRAETRDRQTCGETRAPGNPQAAHDVLPMNVSDIPTKPRHRGNTMAAIPLHPLTRRRLLQASAVAALAAAHPAWMATVRGQDATLADLVTGNTRFALDLYGELRGGNDGNILVSPLSISLALAMPYTGAAGNTASQMAETLGFALDQADLGPAFRDLVDDLVSRGTAEENEDDGVSARALDIANALWGEETYPFDRDFIDQLDDDFGAGLELVSFKDDPEAARNDINDWVEDHTEGRIEDIVPEGAITTDTRLVLANAIWFYGAWAATFEPDNTEVDAFTLLNGDTVDVPFMYQRENFNLVQADDYLAIDLPYQGSGFTCTILLPAVGTFETFEESLDPALLDETIAMFASTDVQLYLPKFSFEFDAGLADLLRSLGMTDAFDGNLADFSGMIGDPDADPLFISDVLHKAFIALDEDGTEAAAATVVIMEGASAVEDEPEPVEVRIDRPFVFAIRDAETGTIIFLGRVLDPS
jgi:serpin B